jgi:hypothetical protein
LFLRLRTDDENSDSKRRQQVGGQKHRLPFTAGQQATLPIWMLEELVRPRQRPVTNVVAMAVALATFLPILAAFWLTRGGDAVQGAGK